VATLVFIFGGWFVGQRPWTDLNLFAHAPKTLYIEDLECHMIDLPIGLDIDILSNA